ncbi:Rho termination factor N-terminal domain-containing protein [Acholeplasma oculi]|nr:Rho termination factor N-terminal domain-containing protein [Acholeplasma oculi]
MLVADLRPIAIDKGIENAKSLKKQELVEALAKIGYNPAN